MVNFLRSRIDLHIPDASRFGQTGLPFNHLLERGKPILRQDKIVVHEKQPLTLCGSHAPVVREGKTTAMLVVQKFKTMTTTGRSEVVPSRVPASIVHYDQVVGNLRTMLSQAGQIIGGLFATIANRRDQGNLGLLIFFSQSREL